MKSNVKSLLLKRSMSITLILVSVLGISAVSVAQNTVKGTIVDESGLGVPGASVLEKGTSKGTVTDIEGAYSISVGDNAVLLISYVGYETQEIPVDGRSTIDVTLKEDLEQLEEVIVVGYGTRKKSHNTGAIAQVGGEEVAAIQAPRVDDALAGKMPGVLIQNQSGEPGADPRIQVRAASSLSGDSNPLIVVDGYPISGSLATVNPNDIESIEVLKDAASAAIYGSRGANGVILVTTKKGRGGLNFSYNGYMSWSSKYVDDIEMLKTAGEWASDLQTDAYDLSEVDPDLRDYRLNAYRDAPDVVSMEDWLFRDGMTQSHDISVRGGNDEVKVFASMGYLNTKGIVQKQGFERYNGRLNVDANLGDKFKAGLSFNGFVGDRDIVPHDMRDLLRAYSIHPIYHTDASIAFVQNLDQQAQALGLTPFDAGYRGNGNVVSSIYDLQPGTIAHDWHYGRSGNGIGGTSNSGPAAKLDYANRTQRTFFANAVSYLQFNIIDGLNIKTVLGADLNDTQDYYWQGVLADARERSNQSDLDQTDTKRSSVLSETTLNFDKSFGNHELSAVAGLEFQNFYIKGTTITGTNLPIDLPIDYSFLEPADVTVTERDETISRRSIFGRVNYAYADRYLVSVSLRRDGDSRFGKNNRFKTFPAVSLGWNIHNESFFSSELISNLKLRFSRGSLGTTSFLGAYDALSLLSTQATALGTAFLIPENVANDDLTWQSNTETNYGFNIGIIDNRFTLGVDYYTSDIEDMLINQSVSEVLGTPSIVLNRGDVQSSGVEFGLGAVIIENTNFNWNVNANLSTVNSEITSLGDLEELPRVVYGGPSGRGPQWRNYVGGEIGEMWGLEVIGEVESEFIADPTRNIGISSSEYYVVDQNNDGEINEEDYIKLGSNTPDFYWGLHSQMNYKNFDFSFQFQGSQGAEVYNIDPIYWKSQWGGRVMESFDENDDGIADHNGEFYTQTRFAHGALVQDASFIALRNLTVGYTFNPEWVAKAGLTSVRVYGAATNLLYLFSDDYTSFNPEGVETTNTGYLGPTTYGYQEGASPIVRSFTLGLNVNF